MKEWLKMENKREKNGNHNNVLKRTLNKLSTSALNMLV